MQILGEDDPVPFFLTAADRHRPLLQLGIQHLLNLRVTMVNIAVNDRSFHSHHLCLEFYKNKIQVMFLTLFKASDMSAFPVSGDS